MNTPLGAYAQSKQDERDDLEARLRKRYGVDAATTEKGRVRATRAVTGTLKHISDIKQRVEFAKRILGASGREPAFG